MIEYLVQTLINYEFGNNPYILMICIAIMVLFQQVKK